MRAHADHRWGIVLAAGEGMRLQEFIRERLGRELPKQFSAVIGTRSLLRHTLDRIELLFKPRQVVTVVAKDHLQHVREVLTRDEERSSVVIPSNRETAPNVLLPALKIFHSDENASVVIFPSDHFVLEEQRFMRYVEHAVAFVDVQTDLVVLLGVQPASPDPGYGWIEVRHDFDHHEGNRFHHVAAFHEKPSAEDAARLFAHGSVLNTMVIAAKVQTLIGLYRKSAPELLRVMEHVVPMFHSPHERTRIDEAFQRLPAMNFSKQILEEHAGRLRVLRMEGVNWNDWGTRERVEEGLRLMGLSQDEDPRRS